MEVTGMITNHINFRTRTTEYKIKVNWYEIDSDYYEKLREKDMKKVKKYMKANNIESFIKLSLLYYRI